MIVVIYDDAARTHVQDIVGQQQKRTRSLEHPAVERVDMQVVRVYHQPVDVPDTGAAADAAERKPVKDSVL